MITSNIHLPRTRAIFDWIFALPPLRTPPALEYESVAEQGLSSEQHASRDLKEQQVGSDGLSRGVGKRWGWSLLSVATLLSSTRLTHDSHPCGRQALENLKRTISSVRSLGELHSFLFIEHGAYAAPKQPAPTEATRKSADSALAATY